MANFKTVKNAKEELVLIQQMSYDEFLVVGPRLHFQPKLESYDKAFAFATNYWYNFKLKSVDMFGTEKLIDMTDKTLHLENLARVAKAKSLPLPKGCY